MKLIFVLLISCLSMTTVIAQQLYNGSFENWGSSYTPDGWGTWASATTIASMAKLAVRDTGVGAQTNGRSSLRLSVDTVVVPFQGLITLGGFAAIGGAKYTAPPAGTGIQYGSIIYTQKPDSLFFDYRYIAAAGNYDTALLTMLLTRYDTASHTRKTFLAFTLSIDTSVRWATRGLPLYNLYDTTVTGLPDTLQLLFYASLSSAYRGTTLWIDSLHFDASVNIVSGIEAIREVRGIYAYPNPAQHSIHIVTPVDEIGSRVILYDMQEHEVYTSLLDKIDFSIPTATVPSGSYMILIQNRDHLTTSRGKITIAY